MEIKRTTASHYQFMFPFLLKKNQKDHLRKQLLQEGFEFFRLKDEGQGEKFYGDHHVIHRKLEKYFLPNIEQLLFPESMMSKRDIKRFTKKLDLSGTLAANFLEIPFHIPSFDILICPFHIGIITIRVNLPENLAFDESIEFVDLFRTIEPLEKKDAAKISVDGHEYEQMKDFLFKELTPFIADYLENADEQAPLFGSLPFFMNEKMFVISYVALTAESQIDCMDLYRIGHIYGCDEQGQARLGPTNPDFLNRYYDKRIYDAWANDTYYGVTNYNFFCLTKSDSPDLQNKIISAMYGEHYYSVLLYFFYRIVLMKLMHSQSDTNINQNEERIEELIIDITEFSANYYFPEVNNSTFGKDMYEIVKEVFRIEYLQSHLGNTLETLYQNHERLTANRTNNLLQVLTIYSVISGILGMNIAVDDLKNGWNWNVISHFSWVEYFGLFLIISAMAISMVMGYYFVKKYIRGLIKKRKNS
ncbi:hypothetical protein [Bacillus testis]|uniref:hypothetical protein n=1 Tax=Bacillus testis TaxID=1622072 RepID=UPI00067F31C1|nr:hypothetical protein [Bacillus testis]